MYRIKVKKKVSSFIDNLENSTEILGKLKLLKYFKTEKELHLDIQRFKGEKGELYRLRIGKIRFIFEVDSDLIFVKAADYRGKIYK